jgi:phage terminase large subunit-like protein
MPLVEHTVRAIDPGVSFRAVSASRGKLVRAEPCAALFEQNRVKIAGLFSQLEDELCTYCGTGDSPNLLDAMSPPKFFSATILSARHFR